MGRNISLSEPVKGGRVAPPAYLFDEVEIGTPIFIGQVLAQDVTV
jgi:hypothetical protein